MHLCRHLSLLLTIPFVLGALPAHAGDNEGNHSQILLQTIKDWGGTTYDKYPAGQPQITVMRFKLPPHTQLPWHTHPMPNAAYVVKGTLIVETADGKHKTIVKAGHVLPEMVNQIHHGYTGDEPLELIVFYAGAEGLPTAKPASAPPSH